MWLDLLVVRGRKSGECFTTFYLLEGVPYNPAKVGLELQRIKVKLRQPSQREDTKNSKFKHIGHSDWADLRKSSLARIRLSPDYSNIRYLQQFDQ